MILQRNGSQAICGGAGQIAWYLAAALYWESDRSSYLPEGKTNMEHPTTILAMPIFPLNVVLFPGMPLSLHIFEERYKLMIGRCLAGNRAFGVTLRRPGAVQLGNEMPHEIGTIAQIVQHVELADGCYNLVTRGTSRYQILEQHRESGYLTAHVALLAEEEDDPHLLAPLCAQVEASFIGLIDDLAALTQVQREPIAFPEDPTAASYLVAHYLPIYPWEKQRLLEAYSTDARLIEAWRLLRRERGLLREFGTAPAIYQLEGEQLLQPN